MVGLLTFDTQVYTDIYRYSPLFTDRHRYMCVCLVFVGEFAHYVRIDTDMYR